MLTAFVIVKAYDLISGRFSHGRIMALGMSGVLVLFLTLSGVIDFFAIVNTPSVKLRDIGSDPRARWFAENTPKDAVVLASKYLYAAPSIAGRKSFLGWQYFTISLGYDSRSRLRIVKTILSGKDHEEMCRLLRLNNISYIEVGEYGETKLRPPVNTEYFRANFSPEYASSDGRNTVYSTAKICE